MPTQSNTTYSAYETEARIRDALRCGRSGCPCGRRTGNVHCPVHDDRSPSLGLTVKANTTLVHCFSGCSSESVLAVLVERGLWSTAKRSDSGHAKCPACGSFLRWPDGELGDSWWCEDCQKHVLWRNAKIVWYETSRMPRGLKPAVQGFTGPIGID